jgi:hypothetical protein
MVGFPEGMAYMKLVNESGAFFLEEKGNRVALTARELSLFREMTPLSRKLSLRKRAVDRILSKPDDPEVRLMMTLSQLPAYEWSFLVPETVA